ncbi:peptidylprolyl isomerase [Serinibacter arcticus]|uniref:Peptidylprolyl isomerase n=1 Tax=Serinibacter arcticus TaxID=1655435 RepID=A0A2U1ZRL3_9MICO|nr:peptidylprolyl isomerase [Serinibacter arcticus]PWD49590.1 peptidylprolyl isomerase [Serinibacter arcticus]
MIGLARGSRRRSLAGAATAALLVVGLVAGCQEEAPVPETPQPTIEVAGDFGVRPTITVPEGLTVAETSSAVLIPGDGPVVAEGGGLLLDYVALDVVTGETVADTFPTLPEIRSLTVDSLGAPLYELLEGVSVGTRIERVELGTAARPNPHVLVVDVLPVRATGQAREPEAGFPTVTLDDTGAPTVAVPAEPAPTSARFAVLVKGDGPQVATDQSLVLQLTAVRWTDGAVVDTTWGSGARAVALSDLGEALRGALLEQTVGSQVLVVAPPADGAAGDTLVYVVDILATADIAVDPAGTEGLVPTPSESAGAVERPTDPPPATE